MVRVLQVLGGLERGGAETMVMNLYRAIDRTQVQFDFIIHTLERQAYYDEIISLGGKVYLFPQFKGKNYFVVKKHWNDFFVEHPEYKVLHSHVRSYASIYIPIAKKHGVKTIIHSHSTSNGKGVASIAKKMMQYPLRYQADYLFACSDEAGRWLYGSNVKNKTNYRVFPNAIDAKRFNFDSEKRSSVRKELNVENKFVIGHVGRFVKPKNHLFLIDVFSELCKERSDAILLLIGDGELRFDIEKHIRELKIQDKVILLGSKGNTEDYYQAMDVFVFPSLWEGLGIVAIEAQTSGLPCVVSENIPSQIDINVGLVNVLSLEEGIEKWAEKIIKVSNKERTGQLHATQETGYDIRDNAIALQKLYLEISKC